MLINGTNCEDKRTLSVLRRLDAGKECRLILLVAPAGAGKTALLERWAAERQWRVAWITLQPVDNRPEEFLQHVKTALHDAGLVVNSGWGESLAIASVVDSLCDLINELVEMSEECALVLDSYQVIDAPTIHESVQFLLDYVPPQMHLVIASRIEPPLHLARLRVRRQLVELGPQDFDSP